ncbi:hypothetical protein E2C01_052727 [Portunus trituberculatus]|uniref:Tyr recombinase domain-containing protein n=1 Tax=Portunus trituberculatus TaxID=210409 RepID=A0A5B7GM95_PORTR|nr:hypothetical protein [Portunus trituberculatus]
MVQKVADFLVYLRQVFQLFSIKDYKAMLNSIFAVKGLDLNNDLILRHIIRAWSFQPHRPNGDLTPSWNLDVVLCHLTKTSFEPLRLSSIRDLTRKTLILLTLATAQRVGEIQALSHTTNCQEQELLVYYIPKFIAKMDTEAHSTPRKFCIKESCILCGFKR